jgi:hypothetical protein
VYLCGPTDCFPSAYFYIPEKDKAMVDDWGKKNQQYEGYLIKETDDPEMLHRWWTEDLS